MYRLCGTVLLFVALGVSFLPLPGDTFGTCIGQLGPGPDPNTYTTYFQIGLVAPWFHGSYSHGAQGRGWTDDAIDPGLLLLHLIPPAIGATLLWSGRSGQGVTVEARSLWTWRGPEAAP